MRIATWNINSVKQRLGHLTAFLAEQAPDVLCLQEIKCVDEAFPVAEVEAAGYNLAVYGQKTFNGVAILSRAPLEDVRRGLPGRDGLDEEGPDQARYLEATISTASGALRVASIYLPNGNPPDTAKYPYKLRWMDRLSAHARELLAFEEPLVLAGDYNVIPEPWDAARPEAWVHDALFLPQTRSAFRSLLDLGLTDAVRACTEESGLYTFWDYQAGAWQKNNGIRIDHLLLSPQAADRLETTAIHKYMRALEKPSDHVPVSVDIRL
ncbi:MAG: exodeoxyribonuclease III [Chelatococcus sp.]|uniref:exodeoxyribonuclease III n=1 Tax=Chelatococcus sp. TaxID=1953771 RepID=UPI0025BCF6BE|nr:exodeoxyribonuclease III [Chelatococcus sp.]MBX3539010.1 exodeoxyribonuclease III [Chelatococcus sp.]